MAEKRRRGSIRSSNPTKESPKRVSAAARKVRALYNDECQVCGQTLVIPGGRYSEGVHLKPLEGPHFGSDTVDNLVCLCPNHGIMLTYGSFGVADDFRLIGMRLFKRLRMNPGHSLDKSNLKYHRDHVLKE